MTNISLNLTDFFGRVGRVDLTSKTMEGAGGKLEVLGDGWVRKTQKRAVRGKRLSVHNQLRIATWAHAWLEAEQGPLFTPAVRPSVERPDIAFDMQIIETTQDPWFLTSVPPHMRLPVWRFVCAALDQGFVLIDCEFFLQYNGSVAVVDWDSCRFCAAE